MESFACRISILKSETCFQIILFLLTLIGIWYKLKAYSNITLDSDSAQFGLYSYSILHGNYLFHEVYLSKTGNYIGELIIFHLFPQIFSNFDPLVFKLTLFVIFFLTLITFSILIYYITRKITNALIFSALFANLHSSAFNSFFISHMSAVLICGISLFAILILLDCTEKLKPKLNFVILTIFISIFISAGAYSDPYVIFCLIIPICGAYITTFDPKRNRSNFLLISVITSSAITYLFANNIIEHIIPNPPRFIQYTQLEFHPMSDIIPNITAFFQGIIFILNDDFFQIWTSLNIINISISTLFILTTTFLVYFWMKEKNDYLFFKSYLLFALAVFFIFYVFTTMSAGFATTRYLLFPAMIFLIGVSLFYSPKRWFYSFLIICMILTGLVGNISSDKKIGEEFNQNQMELINFLDNNNLHHGYGDYWDSNIITYLSKFNVIVRPIKININESIETYPWNNNDNWYNYPEGSDVFIITKPENLDINKEKLEHILKLDPPKKSFQCNVYSIYVW